MKKLIRDFTILFLSLLISILALFSGVKLYMHVTTEEDIYRLQEVNQVYDYIIVPGAQVYKTKPSLVLKDRLDAAIKLYQQKIAPLIVVSGAYEQRYQKYETEVMKDYLIAQGIPKEAIIEDRGGVTTYDTMIRFYLYESDKTAIISTQKMYADRTTYLAKKVGIDADTVIADNEYQTKGWMAYVREFLAPTKAFFYGEALKPDPKYSLDEIPFQTDGS